MMKSYFMHHKYALDNAWHHIRMSLFATCMTIFVIAFTLVLPLMLWLLLSNAEPVVNRWQGDPKATIYFKKEASNEAIESLITTIKKIDFVESVERITADEALSSFEDNAELSSVLSVLEDNPLPESLVISIDAIVSTEIIESALNDFKNNESIDELRFDLQWVKRLQAIVELVKKILTLIIVIVLIAAMLIISNTIRLIIANRKDEIATLNSAGATNAFIARPFLYSGFFNGFVAALFAFLLVYLSASWLKPTLEHLYGLYFSENQFIGFSINQQIVISLFCGFLGWLSSLITVNVFLYKYRP